MHRDRIIEAADSLCDALQAGQIRDVLRASRNVEKGEDSSRTQKILMAYSTFAQHYADFGDDEKYLMSVFGLTPLVNVDFWSGLLDKDSNISQKLIADIDVGVYNVVYVLPKFSDLLVRETDKNDLHIKLQDGIESEVQRLRVFISEQDNALTDTSVITNVIRAVEDIYEGVSSLYKTSYVPLAIGSIDSGSAKCFDFFGAAEVVLDVKDLLGHVWDRVKTVNADDLGYQIEVALTSAGFVARVNDVQRSSSAPEAEGQRLTRLVARSIEVLLRNGAYTEDMDRGDDRRASKILTRNESPMEYKSDELGAKISNPMISDFEDHIETEHIQTVADMPKSIADNIAQNAGAPSGYGLSANPRSTEAMSQSLSELARNMSEIANQIEKPESRQKAELSGAVLDISPYPPAMEDNELDEFGRPLAATGND